MLPLTRQCRPEILLENKVFVSKTQTILFIKLHTFSREGKYF